MTGHKRILVAADLIAADDNPVILRAKEIQSNGQGEIFLIHVVEYPPSYGEAYEIPTIADWQEELENSAKEGLKDLANQIGIPADHAILRIGQPKQQILEVAEELESDLIILGSHGRHGLGLLLLGSTANAVLHGAKCDVLAVRV